MKQMSGFERFVRGIFGQKQGAATMADLGIATQKETNLYNYLAEFREWEDRRLREAIAEAEAVDVKKLLAEMKELAAEQPEWQRVTAPLPGCLCPVCRPDLHREYRFERFADEAIPRPRRVGEVQEGPQGTVPTPWEAL